MVIAHLVMRLSAEGTPAAHGWDRTLATAACMGPSDSGIASFTCLACTTQFSMSDAHPTWPVCINYPQLGSQL
jgi:hypothetical protein